MPESGFAEPSVTWPSMTQACSRAASTCVVPPAVTATSCPDQASGAFSNHSPA